MQQLKKFLSLIYDEKISVIIFKTWIMILIIFTIYKGYSLGWTENMIDGKGAWRLRQEYANKGFYSLLHLNIVSIMMGSGLYILPITLLSIVWKGKKLVKNKYTIFFIYSLLICLSIYTFLRIDTPLNYYASRYFLPVLIPVLLILFILILNKFKYNILIGVLLFFILIFNFSHNFFLYKNPIYENNFRLTEEILNEIPENSYVFLHTDDYSRNLLILNLLSLGNLKVIYIGDEKNLDSIKSKIEMYKKELDITEFYLLSTSLSNLNKKNIKIHHRFHTYPQRIMYPSKSVILNFNYYIYKFGKEELDDLNIKSTDFFDIGDEDELYIANFHGAEQKKFRWTREKSKINLYYKNKEDVNLIINIIGDRPKENPAKVAIYINGYKISEFMKKSGKLEKKISLSKGLLNDDGIQEVTIESNTWNPSNYGLNDNRELGVAIDWIKIEKN